MKPSHLFSIIALTVTTSTTAQTAKTPVKVSGAMSNVMRKGQLHGTIHLDTIANKTHLYALGPKEYLKGELLVTNGKSYVSTVNPDGSIQMQETYDVKAPFLVYANNANWKAYTLPKKIKTMQQLEAYIDAKTQKHQRPFAFKLQGEYAKVNFHIQNLPEGTVVKSPKDAHQGQGKYTRENVSGEIVGFFSTQHQTIFTHHDTFIHMHYINDQKTEMGHIDDLLLHGNNKIKLYLPVE